MHFLRLSMLKCQPDIVCLLVFRVLFNLRTYVRPHAVCVTASPALLALVISLFPTFCIYYLPSAYIVLFTCFISLCWVHAFHETLLLTLSRKKSSPRSLVAQTAGGDKQGAEAPPHHLCHLVGLICSGATGWQGFAKETVEIKSKSCLWHPMETNRGTEECLHTLLSTALNGNDESVSHTDCFTLRKICGNI